MKIEFCLPVRNEEQILEGNVRKLKHFLLSQNFSFPWKMVIVVNGSVDASAQIARNLQDERVTVLERLAAGKGGAIKLALEKSQADVLVFMDIDLAVSLQNIKELISLIEGGSYDLVIGSRLLSGSKTDRSIRRELSSRVYNFLSRLILKHNFSDSQCGFKAVSKEAFDWVSQYLENDHWFFDTELIIIMRCFGFKIKEIPVDWKENRYDERKSKVRVWQDSWPFVKNLFHLRKRLKDLAKDK